MFWYLY